MRRLILFLLTLAVLAVLVDRGADYAAERIVASNLQTTQKLEDEPAVSIAGFPFLTQFARGRYDRVTATTKDLKAGEFYSEVRLSSVAITFRDVTTNRDFTRFTARSGTARATLSYATLSRLLRIDVSYAGAGKVKASRSVLIGEKTYRPTFTVEPDALDGAVTFANGVLSGGVPAAATPAVQAAFDDDVSLGRLPFDVRLDSLRATKAGIELRLTGKDLRYRTP